MNQDVCIIPTFQRPEFLWLCLEHLEKCRGIANLQIMVVIDNHPRQAYAPQIPEVARRFGARLPINVTIRPAHRFYGNSFNLLMAYQEAVATGARYVFLVEDDVMVLPDFFQWHYAVQQCEPGLFASIASANKHQPLSLQRGDPAGYFISRDYASLGTCLPAASVARLKEHSQAGYFSNLVKYLSQRFPHSSVPTQFPEQDGLMVRIIQEQGLRTAWPSAPRAFHTGFWGYHRGQKTRLSGNLDAQVARLREIIVDNTMLNSLSPYFADVDALTAPLAEWHALVKVADLP